MVEHPDMSGNSKKDGHREGITAASVELTAVVVAVTEDRPRVLVVDSQPPALPAGLFDADRDPTLELALRRVASQRSGLDLGYVDQLYTLGDLGRGPRPDRRLISVAYLALAHETDPAPGAAWADWYTFLPWEDFRAGRPEVLGASIIPALRTWADNASDPAMSRERSAILFGLGGSQWDVERALERYELLFEVGWVQEAGGSPDAGAAMALDHRRILSQALGRLRGKLRYRPVVFELLPDTFTLRELQLVVEALSGVRLHTQNFRRLVDRSGLVEPTGDTDSSARGRPAAVFRFRREVLRERPAPGVGLPGTKTAG
jgi:hypothetical protein